MSCLFWYVASQICCILVYDLQWPCCRVACGHVCAEVLQRLMKATTTVHHLPSREHHLNASFQLRQQSRAPQGRLHHALSALVLLHLYLLGGLLSALSNWYDRQSPKAVSFSSILSRSCRCGYMRLALLLSCGWYSFRCLIVQASPSS